MKPHYLRPESAHRDRWMVSYMDVLTILLIFFVAIAAQTLEQARATISPAPASAPPAASPTQTTTEPGAASPTTVSPEEAGRAANATRPPLSSPALSNIERRLLRQNLDARLEPRGLVISLPQAILFPSGDDHVSRNALPLVGQIAAALQDISNPVSLVGHADAVPIHNRHFKNNWELSAARSLQLLELLAGRYGIAESRLSVASYGSYDPKSPNDTPDGRARNRRVEIVILEGAAPPAAGPSSGRSSPSDVSESQ